MAHKYTAPHKQNALVIKRLKQLIKKEELRVDSVTLADDRSFDGGMVPSVMSGTITLQISYDGDSLKLTNELMKDFYNGK